MQVQLNGAPRDVPEAIAVAELLTWLSITTDRVAVEVNGAVVTRARHAEVKLTAGDVVEVVTFVGGG
ncbi:MAG: sulfur carrier protein ThiS [Archangium sp.]|nr:sulfur carrier protein ThiS [Archangium sp.]